VFSNCSDLPKLGARLHYTYDASNSSLSIAFTAAPAAGGAWVAYAINPTSTGMVGSQALMALKLANGSVFAKTYNIMGYHSIVESKLSFEVWDLTAEASNDAMTIFASLKVPEKATSLNQVWQVGGAVIGNRPSIHPLETENRASIFRTYTAEVLLLFLFSIVNANVKGQLEIFILNPLLSPCDVIACQEI
ncbi:hypothetical protein CRG98_035982, partial [Punica granatum]